MNVNKASGLLVGIGYEDDESPYVVLHILNTGSIALKEEMARKLADDILRNANEIWPVDGGAK